MDKQVDINDPQQYTEEWFNVIPINPIGKEFELPNVSSTMRSLQTHVHSFFNSYHQVYPNRSMHMRYQPGVPKQEPQILPETNISSWLDHSKPEKKIIDAVLPDQTDPTRGNHKCFLCNVSFGSGNALGGHMSSHARKRKREAMRNISQPFNSENSFFDFVDRLGFKDLSTPATITSNSMGPT
jgi:hypothetical protein